MAAPALAPAPEAVAPLSGIGAGIFAVAGTAEYSFDLTASGAYYLVQVPDPSSSMNAALLHNGTPIFEGTGGLLTLVSDAPLPPGTYDLQLAGHGSAAVAWDFTVPGTYSLPAGQRAVVALGSMSNNRITLDMYGDAGILLHLQAYNDRMAGIVNTTVALGASMTFDLPWSDSSMVILVLETSGGTGTYGIGWSATQARVLENSFLLPIPALAVLLTLGAVGITHILRSRRPRPPLPPPPP